MSGYLAGKVWLSGLEAELKPLAATLADLGNDDGTSIYPSVAYICWRLGRSHGNVLQGLKALREAKILKVVKKGGGRGLSTIYKLDADALPQRPSWRETRNSPEIDLLEETVQSTEETVQSVSETPPTVGHNSSLPVQEEPSVGELPLAKPKKKEKVKGFKNSRPARSLNDFPDGVLVPPILRSEIRGIPDPSNPEDYKLSEMYVSGLWREMRKGFRRVVGKSPGNLFGKSLEAVMAGIEKHGPALIDETYNKWLAQLSERDIRYMHDNPHAMGFTLHIDEWVEEFQVQPEAAPRTDPNDGLQLTDEGKKKLALFERSA